MIDLKEVVRLTVIDPATGREFITLLDLWASLEEQGAAMQGLPIKTCINILDIRTRRLAVALAESDG